MVGAWVTRKKAEILKANGVEEKDTQSGLLENDLSKAVESLKVDDSVTGSWSSKAYQEAQRLLGPEHVNLVCDARTINTASSEEFPTRAHGSCPLMQPWSIIATTRL